MPPHSVWERFQFSLKTLEGDCVREVQDGAVNDGRSGAFMTPWCCQDTKNGDQLLQQLICPTVHQIHAWIIAGRSNGTIWEPLLPVPTISSVSEDYTDYEHMNQKYRRGVLALLSEEIKFQFQRTLKQQLKSGGLDTLFYSLKELEEAASNGDDDVDDAKSKAKKVKKGKKKQRDSGSHDDKDDNTKNDNTNNKEEYILQTIFQSPPFQKLTQKLHKKFHYLAEESHSAFLSDVQKCSRRLILEEQSRGSGGNKRKRKNASSSNNIPKITLVEKDGDGRGGGRNANRDRQVNVAFGGVSMRINEMHKNKLYSLYQFTLTNLLGRDHERYLQYFPQLLFTILLRYDALEGAGLQSAIPPTVFRFLHTRFGCAFECFASPFNCWLKKSGDKGGTYGSAFGDTDALFGSAGSFFGMEFLEMAKAESGGCFQANPPFASEFIERMCHRMHHFLTISNGENDNSTDTDEKKRIPLMFVIFVPAWSDSSGWKTLSSSPHMTKHVLLSQKEDVHYYSEGTQHRRAMDDSKGGSHRVASFDTSVFFLQNDVAREKWPLLDVDESHLKAAFAMNQVENEDGGEDVRREEVGAQVRKTEQSLQKTPQLEKQHPQNSSTTSMKQKKKKNPLNGKIKGSSKKKKLMTGGNDEMSILASMGILDSGPSKDVGDAPSVDNNHTPSTGPSTLATVPKGSKKKTKRRRK